MTNQAEYFKYLRTRSLLGRLYRTFWLYPNLTRQLKGRVLDVGCGIGDMLEFRPNTVGVDVNPLAVDWNVQRGLEAYLTVDGKLPFNDGVFDGAIMDNVLEHIPDPEPLLLEVRRVLTPQAVFLVGVPGIKGYAADPDHKVFYDEVKLKACLSRNGFSLVRVFWMPWRWKLLDSKFKYYFLYGVFHLTKA